MKKFTEQDVLAVEPGLTAPEIAEVLAMLHEPPVPMEQRWAEENDDIVRMMLSPPKRGRDGLTDALREVNAFADERGLPIPFPPK